MTNTNMLYNNNSHSQPLLICDNCIEPVKTASTANNYAFLFTNIYID